MYIFDNLIIRKYTLDIIRYCNDPTDLKSYRNIINRNYSWLITGVSIDINWLLPYVRDSNILSFCCGVKFFTKEELKFMMSSIFTKIVQLDTALGGTLLENSIENRRLIDYKFDMIKICRCDKLIYKFIKNKSSEGVVFCLTILSKVKDIIYNFIYVDDVSMTIALNSQGSLEIVPRTEGYNKNKKHRKNIHQYLSKQFLTVYYG